MKVLLTKDNEIKKILIDEERLNSDINTNFGIIKKDHILMAKEGDYIKSHIGKKFLVAKPSFTDVFEIIQRGPQIITLKDASLICAYTGINKESIVLDAGTGSGALTCFLANIAKTVYSYEKRKDFFKIAEKNIKLFGFKNIILKNRDVYKKIDEKDLDLIVLDLPEPWKALKNVKKSLKRGGFFVCYLPTTNQVMELLKHLKKIDCLNAFKVCEIIEREWKINDKALRPKNIILGHTGFLVFIRKI
ncbi:MAG: tRNA (adenine-N1)-methyltransferase [Candidatus Parvarchaeota archaeon]|nr:tRNA (adenine-N1)-methyltransferase [Candidatus Jingweiarchaeum tengchongense]MCW1298243.1 tRNA (adenine-N1)-methyltransferase [Candidatus Jingweiarchaeum tengchongense]MCW1300041.1 tRNA (adenine-N1)-methyltransferase [Candidatus Jingweiarchaeum tengchongense]MCW1304820.1 tRNA (adenine-N1)-methyltransferase [Candidatus Jingweiarchaeum tengchongense]MCW1305410.1 tRNA (adenine-N1)-methyltransferase [Candidatus Jingweiarchaeum tengchongense]